jgi:hypothetical protein
VQWPVASQTADAWKVPPADAQVDASVLEPVAHA